MWGSKEDDPKYHHGAFSGPNRQKTFQNLKNAAIALITIGVLVILVGTFSTSSSEEHEQSASYEEKKWSYFERWFGMDQIWKMYEEHRLEEEEGLKKMATEIRNLKSGFQEDTKRLTREEEEKRKRINDLQQKRDHILNNILQIQQTQSSFQEILQMKPNDPRWKVEIKKLEQIMIDEGSMEGHITQFRESIGQLEQEFNQKRAELHQEQLAFAAEEAASKQQNNMWNQFNLLLSRKEITVDSQGNLQVPKQEHLIDKTWREELGSKTWRLLHTAAAKFAETPSEEEKKQFLNFLQSLKYVYPCEICRSHFSRTLLDPDLQPLEASVESRETLSLWMCKLHNIVNERLKKPLFSCNLADLDDRYLPECSECEDEE